MEVGEQKAAARAETLNETVPTAAGTTATGRLARAAASRLLRYTLHQAAFGLCTNLVPARARPLALTFKERPR